MSKAEESSRVGVRGVERAVGERNGADSGRARGREEGPDPELVERPKRRRFTAKYKLRILREADSCTQPGEIGAMLRREGLYTSHLSAWRKQRDKGALAALGRRRGRPKAHPLEEVNQKLQGQLERTQAELAKARKVIEVQGNVSALLGELLDPTSAKSDESGEG